MSVAWTLNYRFEIYRNLFSIPNTPCISSSGTGAMSCCATNRPWNLWFIILTPTIINICVYSYITNATCLSLYRTAKHQAHPKVTYNLEIRNTYTCTCTQKAHKVYMWCGDVIISTILAMTPCCGVLKHCRFVSFYNINRRRMFLVHRVQKKGATLFSTITLAFGRFFKNFYTVGNRNKYSIITCNLFT